MVFSTGHRTDPSPATYSESTFAFLDRVDTPYWERVRALVEVWFDRLPASAQQDAAGRLQSADNRQFRGAFWELYCHETLIRLGYSVECHPQLSTGGKRPDFVACSGQQSFVLEATAATKPDDETGSDRRAAQVYDVIDQLDSPNFFLAIEVERIGAASPSATRLRQALERWLRTLNPDHVERTLEQDRSLRGPDVPRFVWTDADWHITFEALPKKQEARRKSDSRGIGMHGPSAAYMIDDRTPIYRALSDKATAYGRPTIPYIVAIAAESFTGDDHDAISALFGTEQVTFTTRPDGSHDVTPTRARDGFFLGPAGIRNRRVSAVLLAQHLMPWTVATTTPVLWHHPEAAHSVSIVGAPWREAAVVKDTGELQYTGSSITPARFFDLSDEWPGPGDPFPDR